MKKCIWLTVAGLCMVSMAAHASIYSEDFSGYTTGEVPTVTSEINALVVDGSGTIGSGNAVQLTDPGTSGGLADKVVWLEQNFATSDAGEYGAVSLSFDIYNNQIAGSSSVMIFGIGSYSDSTSYTMNATAARYFNLEFSSTAGSITVRDGTGSNLGSASYNLGASNHIEVFINDSETESVSYFDGTLAANTFAVYVNGSLFEVNALGDSVLSSGESDGMGRFGFYSGTSPVDQFTIDNIIVTNLVPEPASFGLVFLGGFAVLIARKLQK